MSATSAVLSIPEILQQILSELPVFDIIRFQIVNRTWRELIVGSPLLQYKSWLRHDFPDPAHRVQANDVQLRESNGYIEGYRYDHKIIAEANTKRYIHNITNHLNPIIVARVMENPPEDPSYSFEPTERKEEDGFGGYFYLRPVLIRDLLQWYETHKSTEGKWGHMSLYRPAARVIHWEVPTSGGAGIQFNLEAVESSSSSRYGQVDFIDNHIWAYKRPGEPLILTLSDLFGRLERLWETWLNSEREEHYLSHDGEGCDYDQGLPDNCLQPSNEDNSNEEENMKVTFGCKMTKDEHVDACIREASR